MEPDMGKIYGILQIQNVDETITVTPSMGELWVKTWNWSKKYLPTVKIFHHKPHYIHFKENSQMIIREGHLTDKLEIEKSPRPDFGPCDL